MRRPLAIAFGLAFLAACGLTAVGRGTSESATDAGDDVSSSSSSSGSLPLDDGATSDAPITCNADLLTDPMHCGTCARDCQGSACVNGSCEPVVFVTNEPGVTGVAVVGSVLVWTRPADGLVRRMPLAGGTPVTILAANDGGLANPSGIAAHSSSLLLTDRSAGVVARFAFDGDPLWKEGTFDTPTGIASNGVDVFFTIQNQDTILSVPIDGGDAGPRMSGLNYPAGVAVGGGRIFAASGSGILMAPVDGGTPVSILSPTSRFKDGGGDLIHSGVALAGSTVWFTIDSVGVVASVPVTGGVATVLAFAQDSPEGIDVSPTTIYWANRGSGTIMKLAR